MVAAVTNSLYDFNGLTEYELSSCSYKSGSGIPR